MAATMAKPEGNLSRSTIVELHVGQNSSMKLVFFFFVTKVCIVNQVPLQAGYSA